MLDEVEKEALNIFSPFFFFLFFFFVQSSKGVLKKSQSRSLITTLKQKVRNRKTGFLHSFYLFFLNISSSF